MCIKDVYLMCINLQGIHIIIWNTFESVGSLVNEETQTYTGQKSGIKTAWFCPFSKEIQKSEMLLQGEENYWAVFGFLFLSAGYNGCYMGSHTVNS